MELKAGDLTVYSSQFDEKTGALVRVVEVPNNRYDTPWERLPEDNDFYKRYPSRYYGGAAFSPSPETVDVCITDRCGFGCTYCYMDSKPRRAHAPAELVEKIITGFDTAPYQMAIGGGEPTLHPEFPDILRRVRALGTVPNYTTNGETLRKEVIKATNEVCGGVAMTYHAFKGLEWFVDHYKALRKALNVQVNIHLIADKDVAKNLMKLVSKVPELGPLRVVLLAFYPDVGRATIDTLITKRVYMKDLPEAIRAAKDNYIDIAFSEGLLPYFFSRPELEVTTAFAMRSEGLFSCYVDSKGRMSDSSFNPPGNYKEKTIWETSSQEMWNELTTWRGRPRGTACHSCQFYHRCATPHDFHYLMCKYESLNDIPLKDGSAGADPDPAHLRVLEKDIIE